MTIWWISASNLVLFVFRVNSSSSSSSIVGLAPQLGSAEMPHAPEAMSAQREHLLFRTYKVDRNDWTGPISTVHHVNNVNNQNNSNNNGSHSDLGTTLPWDSLFKNITFVETIRTTPDLQLWIFIVAAICLGIVFNLLVLRSILRAKCNGMASPMWFNSFFIFRFFSCFSLSAVVFIVIVIRRVVRTFGDRFWPSFVGHRAHTAHKCN